MSNDQPVSLDLQQLESVTGGSSSLDQLSWQLKSITQSLSQLNTLANSNNGSTLMMLIPLLMMERNNSSCYSYYGGYGGYGGCYRPPYGGYYGSPYRPYW
jgi:hypothetical protein